MNYRSPRNIAITGGLTIAAVLIFIKIFNIAGHEEDNTPETMTSADMNNHSKNIVKTIDLPEPGFDSKTSVESAMKSRRSIRRFNNKPLNPEQVSQLLWAAYGITKPAPAAADYLRGGMRTAPSAGALYPLEIYLVAGNVEGLDKGIYRYNSEDHKLEMLQKGDQRKSLQSAALNQEHVGSAAVNIVYSAVYERTTSKYGERGELRYVPMDLGHSAQNIYLQCESMGLGTCAVGAFDDKAVSRVLKLSSKETPLYIMPVGYPD